MTIIGISGSLRRGSFNTRLLQSAAKFVPGEVGFEIASIRDIPLYDADREAEHGVPESVAALKEKLAAADGLLLATPEYNNSFPGVAKNAIDWLTRPPRDIPRVFGNLPVAVIGATPGRGATTLAQTAWLPVFRTLGMRPWFGRTLQIAGAKELFDDDGVKDEEIVRRLEKFVAGFVEFAQRGRR